MTQNRWLKPGMYTTATSASWSCLEFDIITFKALASNVTITTITGAFDGARALVRIRDDGAARRTITWGTPFAGDLPTTTVANKTVMVGLIYDSAPAKWVVVAKTEY